MAHNIEFNQLKQTYSFAENGAKERAWHRLGQVFDHPLSVEEALKACNADYYVEARPIMPIVSDMDIFGGINGMSGEDVESLIIPTHKAVLRMDTKEVLGIVGADYQVVQNEHAFRFINTLCSGNEDTPTIESCGVLGNGERIFVTCKFPEDIIINAKMDDRIERYLIITTSHDGTGAVKCVVCNTRVVCQNTLRIAFSKKGEKSGMVSFKHSKNVFNKLNLDNKENATLVYDTLGLEKAYNAYFKAELERLHSLKVTKAQVEEIVANVALSKEVLGIYNKVGKNINHEDIPTRSQNLYNGMMTAIHQGVGQDIIESGNGLWLINGITSFYQNNATYKNDEVKFLSITEGNVSRKVQQAYDLISA